MKKWFLKDQSYFYAIFSHQCNAQRFDLPVLRPVDSLFDRAENSLWCNASIISLLFQIHEYLNLEISLHLNRYVVSTYEDWNTPSDIISTHFWSGFKRGAQNFGTPISTITEPFLPLISTPKKATQFTHFVFFALNSRFFWEWTCCSLKIFRLALFRQNCMTLQIWKESRNVAKCSKWSKIWQFSKLDV